MRGLTGALSTAWTAVATHKLRSFLTVLGVVIGVGAVITLMSVGKGATSRILSNFADLGTNLVYVQPGSTTEGGVRSSFGSATSLTLEDAQAIAAEVQNVVAVAPTSESGSQAIAGSENMMVRITGVTPDYATVLNVKLAEGEFLTEAQYARKSKVALLGSDVSSTLFGEDNPVGQKIRMSNTVFTVVGLLESSSGSMQNATGQTILVPLSTLQGLVSRSVTATGQHTVNSIVLEAAGKEAIEQVKQDVTLLLQDRHKIAAGGDNDFSVSTMDELISSITSSTETMTLLLGAIAGISLLVGGIGVMNIMLVSVLERRREIGIRKALGAQERDIWGQFLVDSALLTLVGGVIGVGLGWGASYLVNYFGAMETLVTADIVVLAVGVSVGIGLFFGFYPAWQASRLDPIEALRSE